MWELVREIPDVSLFLALEPEELGAKFLFLARKRGEFMSTLNNTSLEMWPASAFTNQPQYPPEKRNEVELALAEAWSWLEAQGLLVPAPGSNGAHGFRVLSRRARKVESEAQFANFAVARLLPKELLDRRIADTVWGAFMRGEFGGAAFYAMKGVEVAVREAAGFGNDLIGVALMRKAFSVRGMMRLLETPDGAFLSVAPYSTRPMKTCSSLGSGLGRNRACRRRTSI